MRRAGVLAAMLALVGLIAPTGVTAPQAGPLRSWRLAFVRDGALWMANGDGSDQRRVIQNVDRPAWSPDKRKIAFVRKGNVWVANADGSRQRQLTFRWKRAQATGEACQVFSEGRWVDASWDPKAPVITFSHWEDYRLTRKDGREARTIASCAIYDAPLRATRGHPELLTRFGPFDREAAYYFSYHSHPAWSRSGKMLAFVRNGDIWIADRYFDKQGQPSFRLGPDYLRGIWEITATRLAAVAVYDAPTDRASRENEGVVRLSWSPDEQYLAYEIRRLSGSGFDEIHVLRVTRDKYDRPRASEDRRLVEDGTDPCFSPDGRFLAYESWAWAGSRQGIWVVSRDGKTKQQLVEDGEQPAW